MSVEIPTGIRVFPEVSIPVNELSPTLLPEISAEYLLSLSLLYQSQRTRVLLDERRDLILKERLHSFDVSNVPVVEIERMTEEKLQVEQDEARFFSQAFLDYTPAFSLIKGRGSQGVSTVFVVQEYVLGRRLSDIEDLDLTQPHIRGFWERVLHVLEYEDRLPDLQADLPVDLLFTKKNLPDPFRTSNVILTDDSRCVLVDMEEQLGHWSRRTLYGKYLVCPMVKKLISDGLKQQNRITTRLLRRLKKR